MIVVDTSVWSRAWRRPADRSAVSQAAATLSDLVREKAPVCLPGIVLQELLSGVRTDLEFQRFELLLAPFPAIFATREHHVLAAQVFNSCRSKGISTTATDSLIAATTILSAGQLLTYDNDFTHIAKCTSLRVRLLLDP